MTSKIVFITGASSGIGAALAKAYAKKGCKLALMARRGDKLKKVADACVSLNQHCKVLTIIGDVNDINDLERAKKLCHQELGTVDTVIANAGWGLRGFFEELTTEDYRRQFETNVFAVLDSIYTFLPDLKKNNGRLVVVGSVNSYIATPKNSAYCMSKFAIRALTDSLRGEFAVYGVSTTLILPGKIESEIVYVNRQGEYTDALQSSHPRFWMSAEKAASIMVAAIERRKMEAIITWQGKVFVFLQNYLPLQWINFLKTKFS